MHFLKTEELEHAKVELNELNLQYRTSISLFWQRKHLHKHYCCAYEAIASNTLLVAVAYSVVTVAPPFCSLLWKANLC